MKTLAIALLALCALTLAAAPASATPRLQPEGCYGISVPPVGGAVGALLEAGETVAIDGCVVGVNGANSVLDVADGACQFAIGSDCIPE